MTADDEFVNAVRSRVLRNTKLTSIRHDQLYDDDEYRDVVVADEEDLGSESNDVLRKRLWNGLSPPPDDDDASAAADDGEIDDGSAPIDASAFRSRTLSRNRLWNSVPPPPLVVVDEVLPIPL